MIDTTPNITGPTGPLEIVDTEPQVGIAESISVEDLKEESSGGGGEDKEPAIIPSFEGDNLTVVFPETEVAADFIPVETLRAKGDKKWKYPSPVPLIRQQFEHGSIPDKAALLHRYSELLGLANVVDILEESINANCQSKWKQAVKLEEKDLSKAPATFANIFHEGRTREAITSAGLYKKSQTYQKEAMAEKTKNGLSDDFKRLFALAKEYNQKAMDQSMKEMMELETQATK